MRLGYCEVIVIMNRVVSLRNGAYTGPIAEEADCENFRFKVYT